MILSRHLSDEETNPFLSRAAGWVSLAGLSGGNVQKVLVGREIAAAPAVLMAAYPVRGLDINSSYTIYNLLTEQKKKGVSVIFVSMMSVKAYGIAAVMPAEGKEETVKAALQSYIDLQKTNFEFYLADQYEIASNARLETLEDGTVLMVVCEDQDTVFDAISSAILA